MNKENISHKMAISTIVLYTIATSLAIPSAKVAGNDIWISILISIIPALFFVIIYARILTLYPDKNLFEILEIVFGKIIGKIIIGFYIGYVIFHGSIVLYLYGIFMNISSFPETSFIVPIIILSFLCIWASKSGIEVISRYSTIFTPIFIFIVGTLLIFIIPEIQMSNLLPLLDNGFKPVLKGTFNVLTYPFLQMIVFTITLSSIRKPKSYYKIFIKGLMISFIIIFITEIASILVLGKDVIKSTYFPLYALATKISASELLQRLEVISLVATYLGGFVRISINLLAGSMGISKLFNINNYRLFVFPLGLIMMCMGIFSFANIFDFSIFINDIYAFYQLPFQVIIPLITFITAEVKNYIYKNNQP